ncbi:MAG: hypothetical protein A2Y10_04415 [Planctomycetes bacterium GWF2_41_51]|nr:MAG: hypothetical protein A2Y10_04415 [Planctomycetes bacterium GWF2_41_51]HBG27029.1 hypothetical protein [Phycisphaerales bacterium]
MPEQINKILIIKPSALGDVVQTMPAVCCLKKNFPDSKIHWFIRPEFAPLVENHGCVDDIVIFDRKKLGKWWCNLDAFREFVRLIKKLRSEKYDLVFDLQGRFRSAIFAWLSGCKIRIGMSGTQELTGFFYTKRVKQSSLHVVDHLLDIVSSICANKENVEFGLKPDLQASSEIKKTLSENGININNYAVFVPGASLEEKRWSTENFAALADKIHEKYKCGIVAAGVNSESPIVENIKQITKVPLLNLAGKTTILQLAALFAGAKMVVSNDTGPGHIASALGMPIVIIYGYTNPLRLHPYARPWTIAALDIENRGSVVDSKIAKYNIQNISVESVFELISKQMN